jgi:hypothetical protein
MAPAAFRKIGIILSVFIKAVKNQLLNIPGTTKKMKKREEVLQKVLI